MDCHKFEEVFEYGSFEYNQNFVISDKDDVEAFADALEKAANTDYPPIPTLGRQVTDPKEIKALMIRLKEKKMNG